MANNFHDALLSFSLFLFLFFPMMKPYEQVSEISAIIISHHNFPLIVLHYIVLTNRCLQEATLF